MRRIRQVVGIFSGLAGVGMIFYVAYPLIVYEVQSQTRFFTYLSPIPSEYELEYEQTEEAVDLTKASNWFYGDTDQDFEYESSNIKFYTITIPKLKIKNASVSIGGEDLKESLIQYPGTAYPGKRGNAVIFGHSILPQFFNPKDYLTIFSTLPKLKEDDPIYVSIDGVNYTFIVEDMFEVKPTNLNILDQNLSGSYLTLVTCSPPGHPLKPKRLIVKAKLAPNQYYDDKLTWN